MRAELLEQVMLFASCNLVEVKEALNHIKNNNPPRQEQVECCERALQFLQQSANTFDQLQDQYGAMAKQEALVQSN